MAVFYLIRGNQIIAEIDTEDIAVVALPLLGGEDGFALVPAQFADNIAAANDKTTDQILSEGQLVDEREATQEQL